VEYSELLLLTIIIMVPTVRESRIKIRGSEKGREFYIPKSGKTQRVRES